MAEILIFTKRMNYREIFKDDHVSFGEMQKDNHYWVYEDDFVKGLMSIEKKGLRELYVEHFFQGEGIGGQLIEDIKEVFEMLSQNVK